MFSPSGSMGQAVKSYAPTKGSRTPSILRHVRMLMAYPCNILISVTSNSLTIQETGKAQLRVTTSMEHGRCPGQKLSTT